MNCERLVDVERYPSDSIKFAGTEKHVMQALDSFRHQGEAGFCDMTLEIEGKCFAAHRNILAANCPFFHSLFTSGMKDSNERHLKLTSQTLSPRALQLILDYFYTCSITISMENVEELLEAASFLSLDSVIEACTRVLDLNLMDSVCYSIKFLSDKFQLAELGKKAEDCINKSFHKIAQDEDIVSEESTSEFLELPVEVVTNVISRDELMVEKEEDVYFAILKWVRHDVENRKYCLQDLFEHLRYGSLSTAFLQEQIAQEPLLKNSEKISTLLKEHMVKEEGPKFSLSSDVCARVRPSTRVRSFIAGVCHHRAFCFDVECSQSYRLPTPSLLSGQYNSILHICFNDNTIFAHDDQNLIAKCVFSNCNRKETNVLYWEKLPESHLEKELGGFTVLNGCVYVIGGRQSIEDYETCATVECYNTQTNQWSEVASLQTPRIECSVVSTESHIFVIGGASSYESEENVPLPREVCVEKYDPALDNWSYTAPITTERINPLMLYSHDKIYVVGGNEHISDQNLCEVYNPTSDEWHTIAAIPGDDYINTFQYCLLNIKGVVHVVDCSTTMTDVYSYQYDPTKDLWQEVEVLSKKDRNDIVLCTVQLKSFHLKDVPFE